LQLVETWKSRFFPDEERVSLKKDSVCWYSNVNNPLYDELTFSDTARNTLSHDLDEIIHYLRNNGSRSQRLLAILNSIQAGVFP